MSMTKTNEDVAVIAREIEIERDKRAGISWGPVWTGVFTTFGLWILMALALVALDVTLPDNQGGQTLAWASSGIAGILAFLGGGAVTGYVSGSERPGGAMIQGLLVWSVVLFLILVLGAIGAGIGFGAASDVFASTSTAQQVQQAAQAQGAQGGFLDEQTMNTIQEGAVWSVLFVVLSLMAAVAGAALTRRARPE